MFLDLLPSSNALGFPVVQNVGSLDQRVTDSTEAILHFVGLGNANGSSFIGIQQSLGAFGPWTLVYGSPPFTLNGTQQPDLPINIPGPYYQGIYFRYRWENPTIGYVGPWVSLAGPTTKLRWDTSTYPIAPQLIVSATPRMTGFGLPMFIDVVVRHSLVNSLDYSDKGIYITATGIVNGFFVTNSAYFSGWGVSVGADETFAVPFGAETNPITAATAASAQYYVLGDPLPGILGTPANL